MPSAIFSVPAISQLIPQADGSRPRLLSCSVGAAPVLAWSLRLLEFFWSTAYHLPLYSTHALSPCAIIPKSRVCPAMPTLIFMSEAIGSVALLPSACSETPWESNAFCVGSVILLGSPWTSRPMSTVKDALLSSAILASLSLTTWSTDTPAAAAGGPLDDELSPPQPAAPSRASASTSTSHVDTDLRRMGLPPSGVIGPRRPPRGGAPLSSIDSSGLLLYEGYARPSAGRPFGRDDHRPERFVALRVGLDARMILEVQMDHLALGGRHGREGDGGALPHDLLRRALGQRRERDLAALAIALGVDDHLAPLATVAVDDDGGDELQGVDGGAVSPDEEAEIVAADVGLQRLADLAGADMSLDAHELHGGLHELAQHLGVGREVAGDAFARRPQARLDTGFALAAPEEAALAALAHDDEVDVGLVDVGDDLAELVQRLALGLLDGGRAGDGRELRVVVFAVVDRLKVVRLCHRFLRPPGCSCSFPDPPAGSAYACPCRAGPCGRPSWPPAGRRPAWRPLASPSRPSAWRRAHRQAEGREGEA